VLHLAVGVFVDKNHRPTPKEIADALSTDQALWQHLNQFILDNYRAKSEFRFYGKNYGWAVRFRKSGKALLSMYPAANHFKAQIILAEPQAKQALRLSIGESVKNIIRNSHSFPEGHWLFIPVKSKRDLEDVKKLLLLKAAPTAKKPE
jgi:hypothetical protein